MRHLFFIVVLVLVQLTNNQDLFLTLNNEIIANVSRREIISAVGEPILDMERYDHFIEEIETLVYQPPVNATIDNENKIISETIGYRLDTQQFHLLFHKYLLSKGPDKMEVPTIPVYPKVDSELLANIRVKPIGYFETYFNKRKKSRVHNIGLAVEAINNQVVFPGETFSFNEVVGKRTYEKGYLPGPVIIKGKVYIDFGGGICQVSSTLFNAVDRAGVKILERYSHSKRVPYVPPGRDATVSWYGPDFKFQNSHNQPLLIQARSYGNMVSITIYSSDVINFN